MAWIILKSRCSHSSGPPYRSLLPFALASSKSLSAKDISWDLRKDEIDLWRCGGRLLETGIPWSEQYPIFLPQNHRLKELLILHEHMSTFHMVKHQQQWKASANTFGYLTNSMHSEPSSSITAYNVDVGKQSRCHPDNATCFSCTPFRLYRYWSIRTYTCLLSNRSYEAVDSFIYVFGNTRGAPRNRQRFTNPQPGRLPATVHNT